MSDMSDMCRLENLASKIKSKNNNHLKNVDVIHNKCKSRDYNNEIYRELVFLLRKHQLSLQYVRLLNSLFELYSFVLLFTTIILISLLGIQARGGIRTTIISLMNRKEEMIRYISMCIGVFIHLFVLSYPCQMIMDSADIFHKAYNMPWYMACKMSRRTTRLLSILLYRGLVPYTLTAGKMYVLSFQNYASVMQKTLSYFTFLLSLM